MSDPTAQEARELLEDKGFLLWVARRKKMLLKFRELEESLGYGTVSVNYQAGELQWCRFTETLQVPL